MAKSKKKQKKPQIKHKPPKKKKSFFKMFLYLLFFSILFLTISYFWIDRLVLNTLSTRGFSNLSAVYFTPVRITELETIKSAHVIKLLGRRNYRETKNYPNIPGEYQILDNRMLIHVREFSWSNNNRATAQIFEIDFQNNSIQNLSHPADASGFIMLEPVIMASLSNQEYRASNYRTLKEIPEHVRNAVIAIEDERFFKHAGIDPQAIVRAALANIKSMNLVQGGSTLTQQLAKNVLFSPKKTFGRKAMEVLAAISIERRLSKDEILEMYLNEIYLGQEGSFAIHGVAEAGQVFFGKRLEDLSLAEAALLAGIIRAPSYYSPRRHLKRAHTRKNLTLDKMFELGMASKQQISKAKEEKLFIIQEVRNKRAAPYFLAALEQELENSLNFEAGVQQGIGVYTGINLEMQTCAENLIVEGLEDIEKRYPKLQRKDSPLEAGLVAIEPASGLIKAWVGGREFSSNQFNHVNQANRQIGSTIKPFLYLTALDSSLNNYRTATTTSVLADEPMKIQQANQRPWSPANFDKTFKGDVTLRYALENSLNLPAVYVAQKVGITSFAQVLAKFRLSEQIQAVPALALGAMDTTLLKLTSAYAALANGGIYIAPRLYLTVEESNGSILSRSRISEQRVAKESAVFVLTDILKGVVQRGTGRVIKSLGYTSPAAGKTGTSNEARDAWFIGYTPNLAVGVWIGFDDNKKLGLTGGSLAAPIWAKFMLCIQDQLEQLDFIPSRDVISVEIDSHTLERAGPGCPREQVVKEIYVSGTQPARICRQHNPDNYEEIPSFHEDYRDQVPKRERGFWENIFG